MIRAPVRAAALAMLLTASGCGTVSTPQPGPSTAGLSAGEAALQGGAGETALRVSDAVLREQPGNTGALEIKCDALALLGRHEEAAAIFLTLLTRDPNSPRANTSLGRLRLAADPAGAEALFQRVLDRHPRDLTALNNIGIARDLRGRHPEAQAAYRQALAISPGMNSAQVNLALSMAMSGQGAHVLDRTAGTLPAHVVRPDQRASANRTRQVRAPGVPGSALALAHADPPPAAVRSDSAPDIRPSATQQAEASAAVPPSVMNQQIIEARDNYDPAAIAHFAPPDPTASRSIQFSAAPSEQAAHTLWQSLVQRFPALLGKRALALTRVDRDGSVFWRVRTGGFSNAGEAKAACARVRASRQDCFVTPSL